MFLILLIVMVVLNVTGAAHDSIMYAQIAWKFRPLLLIPIWAISYLAPKIGNGYVLMCAYYLACILQGVIIGVILGWLYGKLKGNSGVTQ